MTNQEIGAQRERLIFARTMSLELKCTCPQIVLLPSLKTLGGLEHFVMQDYKEELKQI